MSDKSGRGNQKTHFMFNAVYEIKWKTFVERGRSQMKRGACALHAEYLGLKIHTL